MFRKYTVSVPSVLGKIRVKKNGNGSRYVEYLESIENKTEEDKTKEDKKTK